MTSQNPNTFLSRVFGVNSTYPGDETELSSIRNQFPSDEESARLLRDSGKQRPRDRSIIESDQETSDSEDERQHNGNSNLDNSVGSLDDPDHLEFIDNLNETNEEEEGKDDDEVPLSIMVHGAVENTSFIHGQSKINPLRPNNNPKPMMNPPLLQKPSSESKPVTNISHKKEELHGELPYTSSPMSLEEERTRRAKLGILNPKERALWKWANVENLDKFLQDVYSYYLGSGYYCIMLKKFFELATLLFVVYFTTYLSACIDYSKLKLPSSRTLDDIKVDQCYSHISGTGRFCLWLFAIYFVLKLVQLYFDSKDLIEVHNFYKHLLQISDKDLQTISWQVVVKKIMLLKDQNAITSNVSDMKSKSRIDAHDVANRIMRKENYYIALFNKDILDLTLPIPGYRKNVLTRTLEWNLQLCISGFVFNDQGQVRQNILKESKRRELSDELKKRFMLAGVLNIVLSPLLVIYFLLLYFFRYFNEYRKNPGLIGSRQYTALADWKFREFNELYHIFQRRLNLSVPEASHYVDQFPKEKMNIVLKFVALVSGSFAAVLGIISIVDPDMFFNFEITKDRTVLFYISMFGTIWAISHGAIPEEYQVYDSEASLLKVAELTHYLPQHWEGKLHTDEVRAEFCEFFSLKTLLLLREISSLVIAPFILWFSLPKSSDRIVDFFREYSVHVDGLGYVCTYAMFDFEKTRARKNMKEPRANTNHYNSGEEKMMKSYLYFLDSYGDDETQRNGATPHKPAASKPKTALTRSVLGRHQFQQREHYENNMNMSLIDPLELRRTNDGPIHGNLRDRLNQPHIPSDNDYLGESYITTLPKTDAVEYEGGKEPGVLGLVNQFYKDYHIAH